MTDPLSEPPLPEPPRNFTQRWLSRLAFSFVIIAMFLLWTAGHAPNGSSRQVIYVVGAFASMSLAVLGLRERHRRA